jgi:hypothetical protein
MTNKCMQLMLHKNTANDDKEVETINSIRRRM